MWLEKWVIRLCLVRYQSCYWYIWSEQNAALVLAWNVFWLYTCISTKKVWAWVDSGVCLVLVPRYTTNKSISSKKTLLTFVSILYWCGHFNLYWPWSIRCWDSVVGGVHLSASFLLLTERKDEEEVPAKLLDDLFRKTKATPCIYWLPLTDELVSEQWELVGEWGVMCEWHWVLVGEWHWELVGEW